MYPSELVTTGFVRVIIGFLDAGGGGGAGAGLCLGAALNVDGANLSFRDVKSRNICTSGSSKRLATRAVLLVWVCFFFSKLVLVRVVEPVFVLVLAPAVELVEGFGFLVDDVPGLLALK